MTHLEIELGQLKTEAINMWDLVRSQLVNARSAIFNFDKDLAREVMAKERRVNAEELKIDRDCENIFALFTPVAVDLRYVLAVLKINSNLERIGDIAEGIAKYVVNIKEPFDKELLTATHIAKMFDEAINVLEDSLSAFEKEDSVLARGIFKKDEFLNEVNQSANELIEAYLNTNPQNIDQSLYIHSTIRKLERIGDHAKNISEEIIFYLEAKVLKHKHSQ